MMLAKIPVHPLQARTATADLYEGALTRVKPIQAPSVKSGGHPGVTHVDQSPQ